MPSAAQRNGGRSDARAAIPVEEAATIHGVQDQLLPDGAAAAQGRGVAQDPEAVPATRTNLNARHREQLSANDGFRLFSSVAVCLVCFRSETTAAYLALVGATLVRRTLDRKPMNPAPLDLTVDRMMTSSSLPWNPSTELTRRVRGSMDFSSPICC